MCTGAVWYFTFSGILVVSFFKGYYINEGLQQVYNALGLDCFILQEVFYVLQHSIFYGDSSIS